MLAFRLSLSSVVFCATLSVAEGTGKLVRAVENLTAENCNAG
ncbi:hypothetical protein Chls_642 [Chlamydia suis]|uniref:Uncharacterized protein n=1 Tax=Chlamydia suis TaxID=83559 RepID=A0ABX6ITZ7_9CHLA|nr:hypothetical protein Chls_642 [Chlamydia suis]